MVNRAVNLVDGAEQGYDTCDAWRRYKDCQGVSRATDSLSSRPPPKMVLPWLCEGNDGEELDIEAAIAKGIACRLSSRALL